MKNEIIKIYTGTEVSVLYLKGMLEEIGVSAMIKDDFQSSISAGFVEGTPSAIDLFIQKSELKKAEPIINDFIQNK
ncbi:MAG: DUF2007 domain-containing protein [Bacteroidales bacterium]|nr:DUF2007 domain-containing protein [Bacteroidales bacterium]